MARQKIKHKLLSRPPHKSARVRSRRHRLCHFKPKYKTLREYGNNSKKLDPPALKSCLSQGLCPICAKCDWKHHLLYYARGDERKLTEETHRSDCQCIPYDMIVLAQFSFMNVSRRICSLCDLVVRSMRSQYSGVKYGGFLANREKVECWFRDPKYRRDKWVLEIRLRSSLSLGTLAIPPDTVRLEFTLYDPGSTAAEWTKPELERSFSKDPLARRSLESCIDKRLFRFWLDGCSNHSEMCRPNANEPLKIEWESKKLSLPFRVIDVENNCVTCPPPNSEYVTLSYVWGDVKGHQLNRKAYKPADLKGKTFEFQRSKLPRTIRDAMDLTEFLGERYLWVDALCIMQDDEKEVRRAMKCMDKIYKYATLTIVAANGGDSNSGLPGLQPGTRIVKRAIRGAVEDVNLVTIEEILGTETYEEKRTVWAKRGWTYQEQFFSKRQLVFAFDRVYYRCSQGAWTELRPQTNQHGRLNGNKTQNPSELSSNIGHYNKHIAEYTTRNFTDEGDIINAFLGILSDLEKSYGLTFCWALPIEHFKYALRWEGVSKLRRRQDEAGRWKFPSWSWVGWVGPVKYATGIDDRPESSTPFEIGGPWQLQIRPEPGSSVFDTGILEFQTQCAIIRGEEIRSIENLDDGPMYGDGERECVMINWYCMNRLDSMFHDVLVVFKGENDVYYRLDIGYVWHMVWEKANPVTKDIKLG